MSAAFPAVSGELTCDGVPLSAIAAEFGTPVYVYSAAWIEESFRRFEEAFRSVEHLVCYATKANSNLTILRLLARLGAGADVVSGGELRAALESGFPADRIVFSGVGKTETEIAAGVSAGILCFNVESERELEKIDAAAEKGGRSARIALRINPNIDARSHPYISTGLAHNKFGIEIARAREVYRAARRLPNLRITGVQAHIGSQITDPEPLAQTARELAALALSLREEGFEIETVDIGGGIGTGENGSAGLSAEGYARAVLPFLSSIPFKILIEPGRALIGPAGALVTRVLYVKREAGKNFVVADAGMNDLLRPALYGSTHPVLPVQARSGARFTADVVGPVCETSDAFLRGVEIDRPEEGDLLAILDAGAYGFAMSSNYNFRPRPPEVLVDSGRARLIRARETFEDLVRLERL